MIRDASDPNIKRPDPRQPLPVNKDQSLHLRRLRVLTKDRISQPSSHTQSTHSSPFQLDASNSHRDISKSALYNELQQLQQVRDNLSNIAINEKLMNARSRNQIIVPPIPAERNAEVRTHLLRKPVGSDTMHYKEIFIAPREKTLKGFDDKERSFFEPSSGKTNITSADKLNESQMDTVQVEKPNALSPYFKLRLRHTRSSSQVNLSIVQPGDSKVLSQRRSNENSIDIYAGDTSPKETQFKNKDVNAEKDTEDVPAVDFSNVSKERIFFELQVKVQYLSRTNPDALTPLSQVEKETEAILNKKTLNNDAKINMQDLIMKDRSQKNAVDLGNNNAYLNFYLGCLHLEDQEYRKAIKAFRKFLVTLDHTKDKSGVVLGLNRLGVTYYEMQRFSKSREFHLQALDFCATDQCFAAYYNLALVNRKLKDYVKALDYLKTAVEWTKDYNDIESECLCYGQLGVTYIEMDRHKNAMQNFTACYELAVELKRTKLQLDFLITISKIARSSRGWDGSRNSELWNVFQKAYFCAKKLGDKTKAEICLCNMGALEGSQKFSGYVKKFDFSNTAGLYE